MPADKKQRRLSAKRPYSRHTRSSGQGSAAREEVRFRPEFIRAALGLRHRRRIDDPALDRLDRTLARRIEPDVDSIPVAEHADMLAEQFECFIDGSVITFNLSLLQVDLEPIDDPGGVELGLGRQLAFAVAEHPAHLARRSSAWAIWPERLGLKPAMTAAREALRHSKNALTKAARRFGIVNENGAPLASSTVTSSRLGEMYMARLAQQITPLEAEITRTAVWANVPESIQKFTQCRRPPRTVTIVHGCVSPVSLTRPRDTVAAGRPRTVRGRKGKVRRAVFRVHGPFYGPKGRFGPVSVPHDPHGDHQEKQVKPLILKGCSGFGPCSPSPPNSIIYTRLYTPMCVTLFIYVY